MKTTRRLLLGASATALGLPFLRFAPSALAQDPPKRVVFWYTPNSMMDARTWRPTPGFTLPEFLSPLNRYKDKMVFIDNMPLCGRYGADHRRGHQGTAMVLTGSSINSSSSHPNYAANGPSLDVVLADRLGVQPAILGAWVRNNNGTSRITYSGPRQPVSPENNPVTAFNELLGGVMPGMGPMTGPDPAAERHRLTRGRMLAGVRESMSRIMNTLPSDDRRRFQLHLDEVESLERALQEGADDGTFVSAMCDPTAPASGIDSSDYPRLMKAQIDVAVQALRCGVTRVATLQNGTSGGGGTGQSHPRGYVPGLTQTGRYTGEHDLVHSWHNGNRDATSADRFTLERWYAEHLAYLCEQLGPDLDHTLIFAFKDAGYNHEYDNVPFMLIGGNAGNSHRTGRYVDGGGRGHNALLAAVAEIVGVSMPTGFGEFADGVMSLS
ncbi:MAG: DUF1552 domain-containing protein [Myxococcota bacterium]